MHDLLYIFWDPDPQIFGLPFRWYGLLFASSFFFGYLLMNRIFRHEGIPERWLESLTIYVAVGTVAGARFGHVFFYDPGYYLSNPIEIIKIWEGGLASHGAAIGIIVSLWLWSRKVSKRSILWSLDRVVIFVALSGLFIRSGNLMNSEIVGKPADVPWAFVFPQHDQPDYMRAAPEGNKVRVRYDLQGAQPYALSLFRTYDEQHFTELPAQPVIRQDGEGGPYLEFDDRTAKDTARIGYVAVLDNPQRTRTLRPADSADTRAVRLVSQFSGEQASFSGSFEGDGVRLFLDLPGAARNRTLYLLRSQDEQQWTLLSRAVVSGNTFTFDTLDVPPGGYPVTYRVAVKEAAVTLTARHPTQIYEALAYTLIFLLLMFLYGKRDGKVPYGEFFGYFLVLVFTARFLIEFFKEGFIPELQGFPLNMGQMLSIPFVLAGFFFIARARMRGYEPPPPVEEPADGEDEKYEKEKKKGGS